MDLHYSQTRQHACLWHKCFTTLWIYTILKRSRPLPRGCPCFTTLWIYTILKHFPPIWLQHPVSLPYGFTLFSNCTLFLPGRFWFHYLMDLHYSQTIHSVVFPQCGFTTLWIYTILKPLSFQRFRGRSFTTLWIYTILKLTPATSWYRTGFTTLWIYTILKLNQRPCTLRVRFTTLWIYTILKQWSPLRVQEQVSLPYGFTLFSNRATKCDFDLFVSLPYGFTLFSNYDCFSWQFNEFHYLMDLHYSQTLHPLIPLCTVFHYLMDLHYSQTLRGMIYRGSAFHYLMDLHYSQTH